MSHREKPDWFARTYSRSMLTYRVQPGAPSTSSDAGSAAPLNTALLNPIAPNDVANKDCGRLERRIRSVRPMTGGEFGSMESWGVPAGPGQPAPNDAKAEGTAGGPISSQVSPWNELPLCPPNRTMRSRTLS